MKEISLHIIDIMQNSIVAGATLVSVEIYENTNENILKVSIEDNGKGMDEETVKCVADPFTTSRTTRKVGLGIPLFKHAAESAGGELEIRSTPGKGTYISASFIHNHIDRQPLGDMAEVMLTTVVSHENIDFLYKHIYNEKEFLLDTRELKKVLGEVSFNEPTVFMWIKDYLKEGEESIKKI